MRFKDVIQETFFALLMNKARSSLTILGIVIGIGSVVAMISVGQGAQDQIESNIQSIGSNLLMISPGFQRGVGTQVSSGRGGAQTLTEADAQAIVQQVGGISGVASEVSRSYQIVYKDKNTNTRVIGTTADYSLVRNIEIDQGNFLTNQNLESNSRVAILGPTTVTDLFEDTSNVVGQKIKINKLDFTIIGVTKTKGSSGNSNQDDIVYIPLTTAQKLLSGTKSVNTINVQVANQDSMTEIQQQITDLLLQRHNISSSTNADFSIMNQASIVETATSVTKTLTMLLAAIAGISLIVGGIGIMNMMLTSVTERTREIGLRKAVGAKGKDITTQFLAEAIALTMIGGIIGIIFGWLIALVISKFANMAFSISIFSIVLACGVSTFIGVVFGYYPALRASKLNPIKALKYE